MINTIIKRFSTSKFLKPVKIAVTGAAGNIGYAIVFRIASGQMLGPNQPVILNLIDIPDCVNIMKGVAMELNDCAFPTLAGVVCTDKLSEGFKDIDYALLIGAKPRGPGMERGDLLKDNGKIFINTGKALNDYANRSCKTIVVGNPANTNCLIASYYAKGIDKKNFTAMTRLDHNRALYQLTLKMNCHVSDIAKLAIWGNHSATQVPDISYCTVNGKKVTDMVDKDWVKTKFVPCVQQRGAEVIQARKLSSAASAANACMDHIRDWVMGTSGWTSMAIPSDNNPYGIPKDLIFSFPVSCANGNYDIIKGLKINQEIQDKIDLTTKELIEERNAIEKLMV